jgi:predicted RNase H-like HicB family nuclease
MSEEYRLRLQIRQLETGAYLATSDDLPGLVAQGRTVAEAVEISQDVARKLIESCREHGDPLPKGLRPVDKAGVELTIPVGA